MHELVRSEGTISGGVRVFAAETSRNPRSVMAKWYKLKEAEKRVNGHAPVLRAAPTSWPDMDLTRLGTDALIALHQSTKDEIGRRIEALQGAASDG